MRAEAVGGAGTRATIGIVAGSGPEAGIDLWAKVLRHNQSAFGAALHRLTEDVKRPGSAEATLRPRFRALVESLSSDVVLLACTELPLIADIGTDGTLVDVTDLAAAKLVERSPLRPGRRDGDSPQA